MVESHLVFCEYIMFAIDIIVIVAGINNLLFSGNNGIKFANLQVNIWWGNMILITSLVYIVKK
jgi:hypothetical protein